MSKDSQLDQTQRLLGAVLGCGGRQTSNFLEVMQALKQGKGDLVLELAWYPDGSTHQLVLVGVTDDRVYFVNPLGHGDRGKGAVVTDGGLARRIESDGTQSALVSDLQALFDRGVARALIPN